ncbi:aldo/keto reductase [Sporolactobacillus sp. KGMB 08714]|uniref:aldo/keto reductase n=1 Tax=unclassified Sporolactobacillus TaxID=2628533 RepID=UPI002368A72B|nr:aldo/keto reductase [Sporolactobacillus sp. CQH2019]MDD9149447.1 aldo/keto reductase [Sporolactobacillus sp. CQH2019]
MDAGRTTKNRYGSDLRTGTRREGWQPGTERIRKARRQGGIAQRSALTGPERICKEIDDSLTRPDTDYIDIYQVHRPDPARSY